MFEFFFVELSCVCINFVMWVFPVPIAVPSYAVLIFTVWGGLSAIVTFSLQFFEIGFEAPFTLLWFYVRAFKIRFY